jgi:lipoprotein-releasing system permease protein
MRLSFLLALRYLASRKRASISVSTFFAIAGVILGVSALATAMSVTGGFHAVFRDKVLGVNAHVLVLKYSTDFREYRQVMEKVRAVPGIEGVAPFSINPMMLTHATETATGVLVKGVDPGLSLGVGGPPGNKAVLDLPLHVKEGTLEGLRLPDAKPAERRPFDGDLIDPRPAPDPLVPDPGIDPDAPKLDLLKEIEKRIREDEERKKSGDGEKKKGEPIEGGAPGGAAEGGTDDPAAGGGPVGSVVPEGGYTSVLPSDDDLPPEVDPDPCANPETVKKLPGIVVGLSLAKNLKLGMGDCVTVTSPTIGFSFSGGQVKPPVARRFRVIAFFEAGFDQYDSKLVYVDLFEAQRFYDQGDTVMGVEMRVSDIDRTQELTDIIDKTLGTGLYHTMDWMELNRGLFTALRIQQILMSTVLALIILVAAFTIVATLIMMVLDKKKEIAVLKAMGATDAQILGVFLFQGALIAFVGTTLGLLEGYLNCTLLLVKTFPLDPKVYFISHLPVLVRWQEFALTGVIAVVICLAATIIPALYAARMLPADGFRDT